ncbi:MAG: thioredoxin domain-containing protein [Longimicrobiales bacterium]|nr:thioredoxin domain-containing protein [Longimicrobiales bacterium]
MNRSVIVIIAVLLIGVGAVAFNLSSGAPAGTATIPVEFEGMDDPQRLAELAQPVVFGNPDAAISVVEFGDYGCPACAQFMMQVKPQIDLAYGEADDVNFVFYDFPIISVHPHAFVAARAARCADDQGEYWAYHAALFENQGAWSLSASTPISQLEDYAGEIGLDRDAFRACLRSDRHAEVVSANLYLAQNLGVAGTPTVMVSDGSGSAARLGNSFEAIRAAVEAARDTRTSGGEGGA